MKRKDILRPMFGMVTLQPPTILWCYLTDVPYLENMGIFTIIATIYLIPVYAWYERKFPQP